jgi:hypothetical protein
MSKMPPTPAPMPAADVHHFALDKPWARFDESIQKAARSGQMRNAEPLVRELNSAMRIFSGLAAIIEIVSNNSILEDQFDEEDAESNKPLSPLTIGRLLMLASEICDVKSDSICSLADWADRQVESQEGK